MNSRQRAGATFQVRAPLPSSDLTASFPHTFRFEYPPYSNRFLPSPFRPDKCDQLQPSQPLLGTTTTRRTTELGQHASQRQPEEEALRSIVSKATFEETKVSTWYAITAPTLHARSSSKLVARPRTIRLRSPASPFVR